MVCAILYIVAWQSICSLFCVVYCTNGPLWHHGPHAERTVLCFLLFMDTVNTPLYLISRQADRGLQHPC